MEGIISQLEHIVKYVFTKTGILNQSITAESAGKYELLQFYSARNRFQIHHGCSLFLHLLNLVTKQVFVVPTVSAVTGSDIQNDQ